jgi:hypothetical protein
MWLAATNKCLAQSNKFRTGVPATNERPAARRYRDKAREKAINPAEVASVVKRDRSGDCSLGSVQNLSHFLFWLSGARPWLTR